MRHERIARLRNILHGCFALVAGALRTLARWCKQGREGLAFRRKQALDVVAWLLPTVLLVPCGDLWCGRQSRRDVRPGPVGSVPPPGNRQSHGATEARDRAVYFTDPDRTSYPR